MPDEDLPAQCARAFASVGTGARAFSPDELSGPEPLRLYRATASEQWMLDKSGQGPRYDHRTPVTLTPAA